MIENRIIHYNSYGILGGCSVNDQQWGVRIHFYKSQDILNFYNFFGFVLKDIDREKTNIGYYHWSNARISTPISFSSTDYIIERDIEQVKERVELENEIMSEYKEKMTALENEQKGVYKHYNLLVMFIWLCVLLMTCFMCPVYIVKKKHETKLTNDIDSRKKNLAKELLSKIDFIDIK